MSEYHDRCAWILNIFGHSFEFERDNSWDVIEKICDKVSGHDDIWYATNIDIYGYVADYRRLVFSGDGEMIFNPTSRTLYLESGHENYSVNPGETIKIKKMDITDFVLNEE